MNELSVVPTISSRRKTAVLVEAIKNENCDFEWYPTTVEMMDAIKADIEEEIGTSASVLDAGAGDGRMLKRLTKGSKYAIEKSKPLLDAMDRDIFIVGTEFEQQTLIDKRVDVVVSNPPYSEYVEWASKIIREANCNAVYLVIPNRWRDNETLQKLIKLRRAEVHSLGNYDFKSADRQARAKVEVIRIDLGYKGHSRNTSAKVDPFDIWFDSEFDLDINKRSVSKYEWSKKTAETKKEALKNKLVAGHDLVSALENLYLEELSLLMENYKGIEKLNSEILEELNVNIDGLKSALRQRVEGLKDRYWNELFNNMDKITSRLTTSARERMLSKLLKHTHVDFTASNAHAIMVWVIKSANMYFDDQLVTLVERMTEEATISLYKSNQRVFRNEDWKYCRTPEGLDRYSLDYRIVLHRVGGLCRSTWEYERKEHNGLQRSSYELLSDILTVANNLNMDTSKCASIRNYTWDSNKKVTFEYYDHNTQTFETLFDVRAFYNGNLHIRFCQKFIKRLNVEHGRLRGWIKTPAEAVDEFDIDLEEAQYSFGTNVQLGSDNVLSLCAPDI